MARRKQPAIPDQLLDQLLAGADPKTAFAKDGLLDELKKAFAERALNAGMDHHLGGDGRGDSRNGYGRKTVLTDTGRIELEVPRDRQATFDPQLIAKHRRRFPGFDAKVVSMYARGMSTREIQGHLREGRGLRPPAGPFTRTGLMTSTGERRPPRPSFFRLKTRARARARGAEPSRPSFSRQQNARPCPRVRWMKAHATRSGAGIAGGGAAWVDGARWRSTQTGAPRSSS